MKKIYNRICVALIFILCVNMNVNTGQAKSVNSVVKYCKKVYYQTQANLDKYSKMHVEGEYTDYYDKKKKVLWKAVTYPTAKTDVYLKKYTAEYFYDKKQRLVFAFAYWNTKVWCMRVLMDTDFLRML